MRHPIIEEDLHFISSVKLEWECFRGKTILVTGGNGFLPAYMIETILFINEKLPSDLKSRVIVLARNKEYAIKRFEHYIGRPDLSFLIQDVCNPLNITEKIDYIIHAASNASPKYYGNDPVGTLCPNVIGTYHLLEYARRKGVEAFLFFSSGDVYGDLPSDMIPARENYFGPLDPLQVRSCYAESKRMGENMCISWHHQYDICVKIIRPTHTYGPGMKLDDGRVFSDFVADIVNDRDITLYSDGTAIRSFCYLADAVAGFFTVLFKGENGDAYNIGTGEETSIMELAQMLVSLFPEKNLRVIQKELPKDSNYIKSKIIRGNMDIAKIIGIGWRPSFSVKEGFLRTIRSF
ncbi:MAG: NAD-dependent epimerase/dehydratase family protein [Nitrospirae bacterium]|nr:NAD-dependent epimerase/dehydratase family protein [Nitrospirota bacterium]MBF0533464.1 NAD-dependent epimerase/dehydratase family protein [Nitrospirota bacterium]MBF0616012.1 NAD-dependent epimerase/dehydratase family protein [Nitrospirota bacterium]